jgi:hypothetical protein
MHLPLGSGRRLEELGRQVEDMGQLHAATLVEWQPALFEVGQPSGWNIREQRQVDERETAAVTEGVDVGHSSPG